VKWNRWLALGAGAAFLALAALLGSSSAEATFPGKPGLVAFDSHGRIWTVSPSQGGASARELGVGTEPAFSPNGQLIAFVKGGGDLMVMRTDGSGERTVFSGPERNTLGHPSFSADGQKIFFSRDTGGEGYSDLYSVPLAGGSLRRLTHTGGHDTEVSADFPDAASNGRFVAFQRDGAVMTMRPNGSHLKPLTKGLDPSLSPNSRQVVVQRFEKLAVVGAGGGGERVLNLFPKKHPGELIREASAPAFSPDGRSIVFTLRRTNDAGPHLNQSKRLEIYSFATHKIRQLTSAQVGGSNPAWQPVP
jgi:Tol biopolymer transport system component